MEDYRELKTKINRGRTFRLLPILDLYIFREFMIPFTVLAFTFTLLFLIGDVFNDLSDFLENKAPVTVAARYFILKMPGNIRFILPIAVLLSCMYTVANLGRTREITAMRASGVSMLRCGGVIFVVALCVTGVNFWFNEQLVPTCDMKAEVLIRSLGNRNYEKEMYSMLQYRSADKMRDWLFRDFDVDGVQHKVLLKQYEKDKNGKRHIKWDLSADEARCTENGWSFKNAILTRYNSLIHIPGPPEKIALLEIPHGGNGKHQNSGGITDTIPENLANIQNAVKPPEELSSPAIYRILKTNPHMAPSLRNIYETYLYYRLAFPWVCFLCVFLGLPLAVKNERSGIFLSIVTAVGAIVLFQVLTEIFLICGKQGIIPPAVGGIGPIAVFMFYSYWFVIRKSA